MNQSPISADDLFMIVIRLIDMQAADRLRQYHGRLGSGLEIVERSFKERDR